MIKTLHSILRPGLASVLLLAGCDRHSLLHEHGHEHEENGIQVTVWGERHELFLEYDPPVAGTEAAFAIHVTELATGQPRRAGSLILVLLHALEPVSEHLVDQPVQPGIYVPEVVFPSPGLWKAAVRIPGDPDELVPLPAVRVYETGEEAAHDHAPRPPEGIDFLKEQQWRVGLLARPAGRRAMIERLSIPATIAPVPGGKALVHAPLPGRFIAEAGEGVLGQTVQAGDVLGFVDPGLTEFTTRLVEARAESARAEAAREQAELTYERVRRLAEQQARSQRDLEEAEFAFRTARVSHEAAEAVVEAFRQTGLLTESGAPRIAIHAPVSGRIESVHATAGELVIAETALFTIVNTADVYVHARISERQLSRIQTAVPALIALGNRAGEWMPLDEANQGKLIVIGQEVDPVTRTVMLTYQVANPQGRLRLGTMLTVQAATADAVSALAIPASAVVEEEGLPVAFVQLAGETFEMRDLELGIADSGWVEIRSGIQEGERVVVSGAYPLLLSTKSAGISDHHHHH